MPIPVVIAAWAAVSAAVATIMATKGADAAAAFLKRQLNRHRPEIEKWAMGKAWEAMGFGEDVDLDNLTGESFTNAINRNMLAGTGLELTNIFSREMVQRDLERHAMKMAAQHLGVEVKHPTVEGVREAVRSWAGEQLADQIEKGGGEWLEAARDLPDLAAAIARIKRRLETEAQRNNLAAPVVPKLKMDEISVANRARQAKYRQTNKRRWVPHGYGAESDYEPIAGE